MILQSSRHFCEVGARGIALLVQNMSERNKLRVQIDARGIRDNSQLQSYLTFGNFCGKICPRRIYVQSILSTFFFVTLQQCAP